MRFSPKGFSFKSFGNLPNVQFRFKGLSSFDQRIFQRNWRNINLTPLQKAGLVVRRGFRDLIRPAGKKKLPSKPGKPPKSQHPSQVFRRVYSVVDRYHTKAIIGHEGLHGSKQTVMEIHEFGQPIRIKVRIRNRKKARSAKQAKEARRLFLQGKIKPPAIHTTFKTIRMPERKFALPALQRARVRIPQMWKNSVSPRTIKSTQQSLALGQVRNT